ncbi:MAG: hypothetical protein HC840_01335 [Leptolyngbyaceae cyanobacterium RM2_2_4]|nr:hypothetical protein [Leptolyngbyaceae cyanobacterium RM2_2_4]
MKGTQNQFIPKEWFGKMPKERIVARCVDSFRPNKWLWEPSRTDVVACNEEGEELGLATDLARACFLAQSNFWLEPVSYSEMLLIAKENNVEAEFEAAFAATKAEIEKSRLLCSAHNNKPNGE